MRLYIVKITETSFGSADASSPIDTVFMDLSKDELDHHLENDILPFRKEKALKLKNEAERYRSIAASYVLKKAIEDAGYEKALEDGDIIPEYTERGKLYFKKPGNETVPFFVSLSHAGDCAACLISKCECGVDIESIGRFRRMLDRKGDKSDAFIKRFLSEEEYTKYTSPDVEDKALFLTEHWTKKEALVKLSGEGLAAISDPDPAGRVYEISSDGYIVSVAVQTDTRKQNRRLSYE